MNPQESSTRTTATPHVGRIRRGWDLTKSSWHVLKLDRELTLLPLISFFVTLGALLTFALLAFGAYVSNGGSLQTLGDQNSSASIPGWAGVLLGFGIYFVSTFIANYFSAAVIFGAVERFQGGDPTVKSSLAGARRKFRPLLVFSLMMATVGFILQAIEERVPFAGKIAVWLFDAAWNIANLFAIPVIVLSNEDVGPVDATKKSAGIIKKIWGESIVANFGIGLIALLAGLLYFVSFGLLMVAFGALVSAGTTGWILTLPIVVGIIGAVALSLIFTTLSAITKAALYQYATTGEAPGSFKQEMLQASMTVKKARKIFA